MIKVYGYPFSTCTRKVLMTLHEKNTPYEFIIVDLAKQEQKFPEHLTRQPFGVVPVIDDEGFQMYESAAIIRYLDKKLSGISLTPSDPHAYGLMEQWMSVGASYFNEPAVHIAVQCLFAPMRGHEPDMKIVDREIPKVEKAFDVINKYLEKNEYLAGKTFSLADIAWMPYVEFLVLSKLEHMINSRPGVKAWWDRVSFRPTWVKIRG